MAAVRALGRDGVCRQRRKLALSLVALALTLCLAPMAIRPAPVHAYGNIEAHPEINTYAINRFLNRALFDEWLRETRLDGQKALGLAVTEIGLLQIKEEQREMTVAEWLAHGGMSADEPELPASFRHFYDPLKNGGQYYLTDHIDDIIDWSFGLGGMLVKIAGYFMPPMDTENPKVDAKQWAFTHPDNRYSYAMAVKYFRNALGAPVALDSTGLPRQSVPEYGLAWRAVGETMHLVADMTIPAHVRNDSHPDVDVYVTKIGNPDPYESTIGGAEIRANASGTPSPSIDYEATDLGGLFDSVARWTNANFYSGDTIQRMLSTTTQNGEPQYPSPTLDSGVEGGYYHRIIDGQKTPIVAFSLLAKLELLTPLTSDLPWGTIDWTVLQAQRKLLIPTAIEASSRVLDNFLPRLKAEFKVEQSGTGSFLIKGNLVHQATAIWPTAPEIQNGAFLRHRPKDSDKVEIVWLPYDAYLSGNRIEYTLEAPPGGLVSLQWDLGGYLITTQPAVLGGVELEIVADRLEVVLAGQKATLEALVYDIPVDLKTVGMSWNLGDGSPEVTEVLQVDARQEATHEFEHTYEQPGEYTLTARVLHPDTGDPLAVVTRQVNVRQFKVQIYPNRVTGRIGFPVEASCLPSESYYRYEWVFGDGKTLADGKSVVQHTYDTAGTYDLTVRMYDRSFEGRFLAQDTIKVDITGQEGECPLCGHVHGPLNQVETDYQILYRDGNNKTQCVLHSYFDKAKTQLREVVTYVDSKRDGPATEYYDNGNKKYERFYQAGLEHGIRLEYNSQGKLTCEREYRNDREDGKRVFYNPDTERKTSEGTVVYFADTNQSLWHGYCTSWDPYTGHKSAEGNYERGKKVGPWREFHTTGELEGEGSYVNDKRDGPWVHYDKTGKLKANGNYVAGYRQGIWTEEVSWPELGYWKGEYVDGRKMGAWTRYRADGSVAETKTYK